MAHRANFKQINASEDAINTPGRCSVAFFERIFIQIKPDDIITSLGNIGEITVIAAAWIESLRVVI